MQSSTVQHGREIALSKKVFKDMVVLKNEMESIVETLEVMGDEELMDGIKRAEKDFKEGRFTECKNKKEMHKFLGSLKG